MAERDDTFDAEVARFGACGQAMEGQATFMRRCPRDGEWCLEDVCNEEDYCAQIFPPRWAGTAERRSGND